jgi:putative endonuclease
LNLYTGVTGNIFRRALEHKSGKIEGFTKKYHINRLVYYETFKYIGNAIAREKQIKAWTRAKRLALIKSLNPTWQNLADGWGEKIELQIPRFARDDNKLESRSRKQSSCQDEKGHSSPPVFSAKKAHSDEQPECLPTQRNLTVKE